MSLRHTRGIGRPILLVTYLSLACKFLIPVGYMPAAIGEGWPVRLCLSGLPANLFSQDEGHHEHDQTDEQRWQNCSFGVLSAVVAVPSEVVSVTPLAGDTLTFVAQPSNPTSSFVLAFRSRAPPA